MKRYMFMAGMVAAILVWTGTAWAVTDNLGASELTKGLYCDIKSLIEGPLGLLVGLAFVSMGLWQLIEGAKWQKVAYYLIIGGVVTAIPTLINSFFDGVSGMLKESEISSSSVSANFASMGKDCSDVSSYSASAAGYSPSADAAEKTLRYRSRGILP